MIVTLLLASGKVFAQYWDWWGSTKVDVDVRVYSAITREPIPGASVKIALDEPRKREFAYNVPEAGITDESGIIILTADFDARGGGTLLFGSRSWWLQGKLEIKKAGYRTVDDWIANYTGKTVYSLETHRIEIEVLLFLVSPEVGNAPAPIDFNPYTGFYSFKEKLYGVDWWGTGYSSIIDPIVKSGPMNESLKQYVSQYKSRLQISQALFWSGAFLLIASGATEFYFAFRDYPDKPNAAETCTALVAAGIGVSGGIACLVGMFLPGKPTALVDYYNRTNSRDQSLENQALAP